MNNSTKIKVEKMIATFGSGEMEKFIETVAFTTLNYHATQHPIIQSFEPGEFWVNRMAGKIHYSNFRTIHCSMWDRDGIFRMVNSSL